MLSFFPKLYQDELLYSIVARYHKLSGNMQIRHTKQELFDTPTIRSFIIATDKIEILASKLEWHHITKEQLLFEHTILPYTICFHKSIVDTDDSEKTTYTAYKSDVASTKLRYCPMCVKEEKLKYGESYWHRTHQIKINRICDKHECCIEESVINGTGEKEFVTLDSIEKVEEPCFLSEYQSGYLQLAKDIDWVMKHSNEIMTKTSDNKYYYEKKNTGFLNQKGLTTPKGRIRQEQLINQFQEFILQQFGMKFCESVELQYQWISKVCRSGKETRITCRHILIAEFLKTDIQSYFLSDYNPIDKSRIQYNKPYGFETKVYQYRERWLKLLNSGLYTRNIDMVKADNAAYTWLSRNDKEWLQEHLFKKIIPQGVKTVYNWKKVDNELAKKIPDAINAILKHEENTERITIASIERKLGCGKGYLLKNSYRLIETFNILEPFIESTEMFHRRKIEWVIENNK